MSPEERYVVWPGPPTWVIWDTRAKKQVGYFPYQDQAQAEKQAQELNRTHADAPTEY